MGRLPGHFLSVLMLGIVSQVGQILLLRELLMVFHGNELSIGIILAAWMIWVGLGSGIGGFLAERLDRCMPLLKLNAALMLPALPATIIMIRRIRGFFDVPPGAFLSLHDIAVSSFVLMAPVCLLLGSQFVLLARLWRENDGKDDTSGAGKTYIGEAAGNVLGGVLFTFLMVRYLNAFQSAVLVGMLMIAAVFQADRKLKQPSSRAPRHIGYAFAALLAAAGGAFLFLDELDRWAYRMQWQYFSPEHELMETRHSKHGAISIARRGDQYSFFQSGHLLFSTAGAKTATPGLEEQAAAIFAHFALVQHERPKSILLIGGGLRGTLSEIARHPVERIDYVELDKVLIRAAMQYVGPTTLAAMDDPRVRVIHGDGRLFVKQTTQKYDMIIADVPDPATAVLNRYYTKEFFREAQGLLNPDGVFVIGTVSTPGLRGRSIANRNATIYHTLSRVFSVVLPVGDRFLFYIATDAPQQITADAGILQRRFLERNIRTEGFSRHHFHILLEESQLRRVNWIIRNHGRSIDAHLTSPQTGPLLPASVVQQQENEHLLPPVQERFFINSDFRPIGYYYTLMFWNDLTGYGRTEVFDWLLQIRPWWLLPAAGLLFVAAGLLRITDHIGGGRRSVFNAVIVAAFMTGFSTMTLQIALLFSFQSVYGFVYEMAGLIVAIFMGGLAAGAAFTHRYITNKANTNTLAAVQLLAAVLACLIAVVLPRAAAVESLNAVFLLFSLLTFVSGLLNGVSFPLTAECCMALNHRAERSAGSVYAVELFGGCLGAAIASAAVVPVLGIVACCLSAAAASAAAFVVLLISRRSYA